jgi:hypothetical protein
MQRWTSGWSVPIMLLLSSGTLFDRMVARQFRKTVDLVFNVLDQLNDRKYRTLQNKNNAL